MNALLTIGVAVVAMIAVGFILYLLLRLNRRDKREQSEVDPAKLRKWSADCSHASAQSATPAGQRILAIAPNNLFHVFGWSPWPGFLPMACGPFSYILFIIFFCSGVSSALMSCSCW